jgi:hypothetical protein
MDAGLPWPLPLDVRRPHDGDRRKGVGKRCAMPGSRRQSPDGGAGREQEGDTSAPESVIEGQARIGVDALAQTSVPALPQLTTGQQPLGDSVASDEDARKEASEAGHAKEGDRSRAGVFSSSTGPAKMANVAGRG